MSGSLQHGDSALILAARKGNLSIVSLLHQQRANLNVRNNVSKPAISIFK